MPIKSPIQQYQKVNVQSQIMDASPHKLIQMLMDGALDKIAKAKGSIKQGDVSQKGAQISWAISIIDGLRMSLDLEKGGDIAQNLGDLYEYMERQLLQANMTNEVELLDEVSGLLRQVKDGWDAIPAELHGDATDQGGSDEYILRAGV